MATIETPASNTRFCPWRAHADGRHQIDKEDSHNANELARHTCGGFVVGKPNVAVCVCRQTVRSAANNQSGSENNESELRVQTYLDDVDLSSP